MPKNKKIHVEGAEIMVRHEKKGEYLSLTDIARRFNEENPYSIISNWMRNKDTIEFLGLWEQLNNPDFNPLEFERIKNEAGSNRFVLSVGNWIESTNAIGIQY